MDRKAWRSISIQAPETGKNLTYCHKEEASPTPFTRHVSETDTGTRYHDRTDILNHIVGSEEKAAVLDWGNLDDVRPSGGTRAYGAQTHEVTTLYDDQQDQVVLRPDSQ